MKNNYSIHILTPCHENWDAMTPVQQGRFCQSCAKEVVDFSLMTDQEVLNYFSKATGSTCGRFNNDQLQRPLQPTTIEKKKTWWVAVMMPLLMLAEKAGAQKKNHIITNQHKTPVAKPGKKLVELVNGEVISLKVKQDTIAINPVNITHIGDSDINYVMPDISDGYKTNMYVRIGGYAVCATLPKQDTVPALIHRVLSKQAFTIYPNPAPRGANVTIAFKKEGEYSIQLFDNNGKFISINNYNASKAALQTTISMPSALTAGTYYIRLVNEKNKNQYTSKLIIM